MQGFIANSFIIPIIITQVKLIKLAYLSYYKQGFRSYNSKVFQASLRAP